MSSLPCMPLWVGDYLSDTQHLTAAEHGAYMLLIMAYWQRGKALPDDGERLALIARMTPSEWAKAEPTLRDFFAIEGGEWKHSRIEAELSKTRDKSAKASASAKRRHSGGNADAERTQSEGTCERTATPTHTQTSEVKNKQLPSEQEAARESEGRKFDLKDVGCGLGGEPTPQARRAVARQLGIADPQPLVDAWLAWPPSRKAKSADAHFRASARTIFANLSASEREACGVIADLDMKITPVAPSPQLVAALSRRSRHAH